MMPRPNSPPPALAVLVNGPSSSGKSTLCEALQLQLTALAEGDPDSAFARVAFDDVVLLMADNLYPISFARLQGRTPDGLVSLSPYDGRAGWEYIDQSEAEGIHGGSPRVRLVLNPHGRRLLRGVHLSWSGHLALGTSLVIDHFLQEKEWVDETLAAVHDSGASLFSVGVFCSLPELERRESARADGGVEGRPLGLARRSDELCHATGLAYDITVNSSEQTTTESVDAILAGLRTAGHIPL